MSKWIRYRFQTKSVDDPRPLIFNPHYPWWVSGYSGEDFGITTAVIVAYLPLKADLFEYWDDAFDIDQTEENEITFTSRFPKPDYFIEEKEEDNEISKT